jgi:hypothetical protein
MLKKRLENIIKRKIETMYVPDYSINLQISIVDNKIIFTTHKIASRFIEELSFDKTTKKCNTVELNLNFNQTTDKTNIKYIFGNFEYTIRNDFEKRTTEDEFVSILGIDSISDIFDYSKIQNYKIIILIRNPLFKFFSGWMEIINTILYSYDYYSDTEKNIFNKIFLNNEIDFDSLKNRSLIELDELNRTKLLKAFSSIPNRILSHDSHPKEWCNFVEKMLFYTNFFNTNDSKTTVNEIPNFIKIIDMDVDEAIYNEFKVKNVNLKSTSYLGILSTFITDTKNEECLNELLGKRINLIDIDYNSYMYLKRISTNKPPLM